MFKLPASTSSIVCFLSVSQREPETALRVTVTKQPVGQPVTTVDLQPDVAFR